MDWIPLCCESVGIATENTQKMNKYTTRQLQDSLVQLHERSDADGIAAYEMTFAEVHRRMGDVAFDDWCMDHLDVLFAN